MNRDKLGLNLTHKLYGYNLAKGVESYCLNITD